MDNCKTLAELIDYIQTNFGFKVRVYLFDGGRTFRIQPDGMIGTSFTVYWGEDEVETLRRVVTRYIQTANWSVA